MTAPNGAEPHLARARGCWVAGAALAGSPTEQAGLEARNSATAVLLGPAACQGDFGRRRTTEPSEAAGEQRAADSLGSVMRWRGNRKARVAGAAVPHVWTFRCSVWRRAVGWGDGSDAARVGGGASGAADLGCRRMPVAQRRPASLRAFPELATVMRRRGNANGLAWVACVGHSCGLRRRRVRLRKAADWRRPEQGAGCGGGPGPGLRSAQHQRGRGRRSKAHRRSKVGIVLIGPRAKRLTDIAGRHAGGGGRVPGVAGRTSPPPPSATRVVPFASALTEVGGGGVSEAARCGCVGTSPFSELAN